MAKKWRECTTIEDYEFDPDGKYDGALYKEQWDEIFNALYQRAETTEEYLYNDWIDPVSTRNARTEYFKDKAGNNYIVLKYYDGMYALYEIKDESEIAEGTRKSGRIIEKIEAGVSIRQAISEAVNSQNKVFEDVAGMDQESHDKFLSLMNSWTGGSGKNGWDYETKTIGGTKYVIKLTKNPIAKFDKPVVLDIAGDVLNGEVYHEGADEYLAASGPVSLAGLKSVLRDLLSQVEMTDADLKSENNTDKGNIYGY